MSAGGLTVVDGSQLRSLPHPLALPNPHSNVVTGAQLLDFAETEASSSLFGLSLPQDLRSSALKHLTCSDDEVTFRIREFDRDQASKLASDYVNAIANELKDDPLVVSVLDGTTLKLFLEDEDDFAMLAENLFTDLDIEDKGKVCKGEIRNALCHMGVALGVPPFSEFPTLNDILKKHGAEGEEELGQAQFAQLLQQVLQDLADALAEKHTVVIQNIKIITGSKLRMLLADEKQLNNLIEKILQEKNNLESNPTSTAVIRSFLEKMWKEIGLPPSESNEAVILLYDAVFADAESSKSTVGTEDEFRELVKDILEKFAEQLDANPVYHDFEASESVGL